MWAAIRRWWHSLTVRLGSESEPPADPRADLERAIHAAREQHRLLNEQAAVVIASQEQLQHRLDGLIEEYGTATRSARQALVLGDEARGAGDEDRATMCDSAARTFAARTIALDREIADLRTTLLEATEAAEQAREAVRRNSAALRKILAEQERLLGRLDQARMQEQINAAMTQLGRTVGDDAPSLAEVRDRIDRRLAMAKAVAEVREGTIDVQALELERVQAEAATAARLGEMRGQLSPGYGPDPDREAEASATPDAPTG